MMKDYGNAASSLLASLPKSIVVKFPFYTKGPPRVAVF
jgi:hypothetical protein